ncbi:MAG: RiPP maturation radical SAM C-methyltransferase [Gemmatimonadaceae bacterium]
MDKLRLALVQMPFAAVQQPSLALTQLKSVVDELLADRVTTRIIYANHDFADLLGVDLYLRIAYSDSGVERAGPMAGLPEWLFRSLVFPELPDNVEEYQTLFETSGDSRRAATFAQALARREEIADRLELVVHKYELLSYDVIGLGSMFNQTLPCFAIAKLLKATQRAPHVVMGGANCEGAMGGAIAKLAPWIDAVFSGPALTSFPEYLQCLLNGGDPRETRGVFSANVSRSSVPPEAPARPIESEVGAERDINRIVSLDYAAFLDAASKVFPGGTQLTFETSRGCWWGAKSHCVFCGLNGTTIGYRSMSPQSAIEQFERLFRYADRARYFQCVDNIMPANYPRDVFAHLSTPAGVSIYYEVKPNLSDEELRWMAKAGVRVLQPGIEALSTSTLKHLRKGTSAFSNVLFLKRCLCHGVLPLWNYLISIPGHEGSEEVFRKYANDMHLLTHLPPPSGVFTIRIDRFSPYFSDPEEYGLSLVPMSYYRFLYPYREADLFSLCYYFEDANQNAEYREIGDRWHRPLSDLVANWRRLFWREATDQKEIASLYIYRCEDEHYVLDSRSGSPTTHRLSLAERQLLSSLEKPATVDSALQGLVANGASPNVAEEAMASLRSRGLLFEEDDRVASLVCEEDPRITRGANSILDDPDSYLRQ